MRCSGVKCPGGGYNEAGVLLANHILSLGVIVPPLADSGNGQDGLKNDAKECFKTGLRKLVVCAVLLNIIFVLLIKSFDANNKFMSIYKDIFLTLLFVYAMLLIAYGDAVRNKFDYLGVILASTALLLTKQMGMAFVLVIWLYYMVRAVRNNSGRSKALFLGKMLPALFSIPVIIFCSWKNYVKSLNISGQFELNRISFEELCEIIKDTYCITLRRQVFNSYFHALFERDIAAFLVPLTYISGFVLLLFFIWAVWKFFQKENIWRSDEAIELGAVLVCGTIGYALVMGNLYLFCFSEGEMRELASYERYMSVWILGEILIVCGILYHNLQVCGWVNARNLCIVFMICICITKSSNLAVFIPGVLDGKTNIDCREAANYLENKINDSGSVFILSDDTIRDQYFINFYSEDINIVLCYTDYLNADLQNEGTREYAINEIFSNDYLYVKDINENFNNEMSYLNGNEIFEEGKLYRVAHQNETTLIEEIQ